MTMTSAVYFPLIHPGESLLKRALLTWDHVEVFSTADYRCHHLQGEFLEAWELVCRPRDFSIDEQAELHQRLKQAATSGIPHDLRFDYKVYKQFRGLLSPRISAHLGEATAELLLELGLAGRDDEGQICGNSGTVSMIFALQAEISAGVTKQQITDHKDTYSAYCRLLGDACHRYDKLPLREEEQLLSVALQTVGLQNISLRQLINFRRREIKEPGIRVLRRKFAESLTNFVSDISNNKILTNADWDEVQRNYRVQVEDDIRILSREMGCETTAFVLSKTILAPIVMGSGVLLSLLMAQAYPSLAAAGAAASVTASQAVLSIAEVISEGRDTINKRATILESHPLAYIYELAETA